MKRILLLFSILLITIQLFSQEFKVPENLKLEKVEDYAIYEDDVVKAVDWLMKTPLDKEEGKRMATNAFLLKWLTGSPNVHLDLKPEILTFMESSPDFIMIFMGGWAKYSLVTKDFDNKVESNLVGIEAVIEFYIKNKKLLSKDKNIKRFVRMKKKGTLREYIEKNV